MASWTPSSAVIPTLILLLSLPLLFFFLGPKILSPRQITISLPEELDDLSLFHKAIAMDTSNFSTHRRHRLPSAKSHLTTTLRRPKIAFLFLTNSQLHFSPLWELFFSNVSLKQYNIYIHADPLVKIPPFQGIFKNKLIPSKRTQRSSPTLISAARRLLATAMLDDPSNAYFALISQHCIPIHSFNYFYNFLFDLGRLSATDFEFSSYIEILDSEPTLPDRYNARGKNVMLPEVSFDEFRVGSQFFVLTRKHALMVIKDRKLWRKFKLPCLNLDSCYPEEHYFPTLLSMQDPSKCSHYTLTSVNWTDSVNGHPHTYHPAELSPQLIHRLRESNSSYSHMFARKFSPDCLNPLMDMADSVIFKD
ncbi:hypothetical protein ACJIZ3_017426 [Penstemon smallii]|uniref:Uncharacterized protein n=1 Tax=Penstemon smallii TaxID=265156 RepID=A0ABD3SVI6_9LAMI